MELGRVHRGLVREREGLAEIRGIVARARIPAVADGRRLAVAVAQLGAARSRPRGVVEARVFPRRGRRIGSHQIFPRRPGGQRILGGEPAIVEQRGRAGRARRPHRIGAVERVIDDRLGVRQEDLESHRHRAALLVEGRLIDGWIQRHIAEALHVDRVDGVPVAGARREHVGHVGKPGRLALFWGNSATSGFAVRVAPARALGDDGLVDGRLDRSPARFLRRRRQRAVVEKQLVNALAEHRLERLSLAELVVDFRRAERETAVHGRADGFKWRGAPASARARERVVGNLLIPRHETESLAERPATATDPIVVVGPVLRTGGDVDEHVVAEGRPVDVDREGEVARAVGIIAEELLAAHGVRDRAVVHDGLHLVPRGRGAVVQFLEILHHIPLRFVAAECVGEERGVGPLG